jgi:WD40 repeat protein
MKILYRISRAIVSLTFSPDGQLLVAGMQGGFVHVYDWMQGTLRREMQVRLSEAGQLAFSADGATLAVSGQGTPATSFLFDMKTSPRWPRKLPQPIPFLTPVGVDRFIGVHKLRRSYRQPIPLVTVFAGSLETGQVEREIGRMERQLDAVTFTTDGSFMAWQEREGMCTSIWRIEPFRQVARLKHPVPCQAVAFAQRRACLEPPPLLACASGRTLSLWAGGNRKPLATWDSQQEAITSLAFSPSGQHLASASRDGTVCFWDIPRGREQQRLNWEIGPLTAVGFAGDGMVAVAGSAEGKLVLWDLDD